jgi:UDP-galactopyranose mutase
MSENQVLVIGGGISGASFAFHAARLGRRVLVVEKEERAGGCLASERMPSGFWYELGAHTCYNSYQAFLEVLEGCGLLDELQARGKPVLRFLSGDEVVRGKNLLLFLKLFGKLELARAIPGWFGASQAGVTVRSYYSRFVGPRNYERVLGPMLSAVPSQEAHDFPADMLFKKRERRREVMRSFTLPGGLRSAVEAALRQPGIEVMSGRTAAELERTSGGFAATLSDGSRIEAPLVALAVPPSTAADLLRGAAPQIASVASKILQAEVDSLGFAVRREQVMGVPYSTFFIPLEDEFHSVVTRDVVPDDEWRGFTFHFSPGKSHDERIRRAAQILHIQPASMEAISERRAVLPSPRLGHAQLVASIDELLAGERLAVTGNWFGGLSIEDCVLRSRAEWRRVSVLEKKNTSEKAPTPPVPPLRW